ncbi:hypothetical protein GCK72_024939 [Caenorhabditis remanei]|uniref:F-box domain-containing protein n=1 Tax=Caenorhabditis remanei TaxID=31234 RepID=A0A6A5G1D1_CAERE|nr:hypothetical protein GCK72_024939 [Caenorhabditis remanei]KAF1748472.1 hypothetical protein GCK72_024939 [Caenorhabditis remanei]
MSDVQRKPPEFKFMDLPYLPKQYVLHTMEFSDLLRASTLSKWMAEMVSKVKVPDMDVTINSQIAIIKAGDFKWTINKVDEPDWFGPQLFSKTEFGRYPVTGFTSSKWVSNTTDENFDEVVSIVLKIRKIFPKLKIKNLKMDLNHVDTYAPMFDLFDVKQIKKVDLFTNINKLPSLIEKTKNMKMQGLIHYEEIIWFMAENPVDPHGGLHWFTTLGCIMSGMQVLKLDGELLTNADCIEFLKLWQTGKLPCCGIMKAEKVKNIDLKTVLKGTDWSPWNDAQMKKYRGIECFSQYFDLKGFIVKWDDEIISIQYLEDIQLFFVVFWDRRFVDRTFRPIKKIF